MYNLGFRNFIEDLLQKARSGHFGGNPGELAEYQIIFRHGLQKFGMHRMDKNAVMDYLRENGIRPRGENGRWALCETNTGKHNAAGAATEENSTTADDARSASCTIEKTKCAARSSA